MKIASHMHALRIPFKIPLSPTLSVDRFVYVYPVLGKEIFLIDSGVSGSEKVIFDYLRQNARDPKKIKMIINTHAHPDHIGASRTIKEETDCSIAAHVNEVGWIEDVGLQEKERPVPGFRSLISGSVKVDRPLKDGDELKIGDVSMRVVHTPGHSRGSISIWIEEEEALITGDLIPVAGEMPVYENVQEIIRSIRKVQSIPGVKFLLSSWDEPRTGKEARSSIENGLAFVQRIHSSLLDALGDHENDTWEEICKRTLVGAGIPLSAMNPLVAKTLRAHLELKDQRDLLQEKL